MRLMLVIDGRIESDSGKKETEIEAETFMEDPDTGTVEERLETDSDFMEEQLEADPEIMEERLKTDSDNGNAETDPDREEMKLNPN